MCVSLALAGPGLCKTCRPASSRLWYSCRSLRTGLHPPDLAAFQSCILSWTRASSPRTLGHPRLLLKDTLTRSAASWDASDCAAAQLLFEMIMPCFIIAVGRLCFVNIVHNRCADLDTCCLILLCTVSICSVFWSVLDLNVVQWCPYQLGSLNIMTMATLILAYFFFLTTSTNCSRISFIKAAMGSSVPLVFDCSDQRLSENQEQSFQSMALRLWKSI